MGRMLSNIGTSSSTHFGCISRMACEDHTPIGQALTLYLHACLLPLCLALLAQGRGYNRVRDFQRARG